MADLRPYQVEACRFLYDRQRGIYADAPGTGKTPTTLQWLHYTGATTSLIVAPKDVLDHWQEEAEVWYPDLSVVRGDGGPDKRNEALRQVRTHGGALLLNYEAMRGDVKALAKFQWGAFVCDEAHRLKGRSTLVTKAARMMARRSTWVALLTGTPVLNRAEELWSLLNLLDPITYSSFWRFVHEFFETEQRRFGASPRPVTLINDVREHRLDDLRDLVQPHLIQRTLDECLPDLPDAVTIMHPVRLNAAERKAYKQMQKYGWVDLGDKGVLQAENHLAKMTRERQMASDINAVLDQPGGGSKAKAAADLLTEDLTAEQVVVLTAYRATAESIVEALGEQAAVYHGGLSSDERGRVLSAFTSGEVRVLVGTLATLGEGVDGLQVARYIVMVDRDWTPARNEQAVARLRRSGQERTVVVYHVYAEGTVDEDVAKANARKETIIASVLGTQIEMAPG